MTARFTVLASGSSGNAAFLEAGGFGLLVDCGLHPRTLSARLSGHGAEWPAVSAAVLTHTHGDHWNAAALLHLHRYRVPLFVHPGHDDHLSAVSEEFRALQQAGLVFHYAENRPLAFAPGLRATPLRVPHDSDPTFAFRFDGEQAGRWWSLGYASDLGHVPAGLAEAFAGVDVLAVEYNHDEEMERRSGRPWHLIQRVLGRNGHLSNRQAAEFTKTLMGDRLRAVVQLHLSRHCNSPTLARAAAQPLLDAGPNAVQLVTATQDRPTRPIELVGSRSEPIPLPEPRPAVRPRVQLRIPGMD